MQPIYLIVGAPAVGKSTTARALAERFPRAIHIPVDTLRDMVVAGFAWPAAEWNDELVQQVRLARTTAIHMALAYQAAGFAVVIDDFIDPPGLQEYQALAQNSACQRIVLYPDQEIAHARNAQRSGDTTIRGYIDEGIRIVYAALAQNSAMFQHNGWRILDNSAMSVPETVDAMMQ
jgi:predicted kinase